MPGFTLSPTGNASAPDNNWAQSGGTDKWSNMVDGSDSTSVFRGGVNTDRQGFTYANLPGDAGSIEAGGITINHRGRDDLASSAVISVYILSGGHYEDSATMGYVVTITNYNTNLATFNGGAWTVAIINGGQLGILRATQGDGDTQRLYEINATGNYAPAAGGLLHGCQSVVGLIGAGLALAHMPGLALEVYRRSPVRLRIRPHEYQRTLEELRGWRRPAFSFL